MAFRTTRIVPTPDLKRGDEVILKDRVWTVVRNDGAIVTVERDGIQRSTDKVSEWRVRNPIKSASVLVDSEESGLVVRIDHEPPSDDLITAQEYLRAVGMPDEDLQDNARVFGTVLMRLYRERYGKDARPAKKLEYVHYLDVNGMEAQRPNDDAPLHLRVKPNGWYESNAFESKDIDLMEAVRVKRHPSLPTLSEVADRAVEALKEFAPISDVPSMSARQHERDLVRLVDKAVKECLASGRPCGHTECARRRARQTRRIELENWS